MRYYIDDVEEFVRRFEYRGDGKFDTYRILKAPTYTLRGDCDDFAVTALYESEGRSMFSFWFSLLTFRAVLWRVKGKSWASHMVLYHKHLGWIDNQNPEWGRRKHTLRFPVLLPVIALKMFLGKWKDGS